MVFMKLLKQFTSAQDAEVQPVIYSFSTLFALLASYFIVMPLREEAGISLGTDALPKLFTATLVGVLIVTPLTSVFLSRANVPREASLRQLYNIIATVLLGFFFMYTVSSIQAQAVLREVARAVTGEEYATPPPISSLIASSVKGGDASLDGFQRAVRASFYIFINVQNLVAISACWARCADVFNAEAASRLFGFISAGAGATMGQLLGSVVTATTARTAGRRGGSLHGLILVSSLLMYAAAFLSAKAKRPGVAPVKLLPASEGGLGTLSGAAAIRAKLGQLAQSFTLIARSRYLTLVCSYLMMTYVVGSLMYFQRSLVVASMVSDANSRTAFFATVYSLSALFTIILQMLATGRLLKSVGITLALASFPLVCALLIAAIGIHPNTTAVALGEVIRKLLGYVLVRPAREVLFTVVSREEKYKAKLTIDAVVQRLGDTLAAAVFEILDVRLHLGQVGVAIAGVLCCVLWLQWSWKLGAQQKSLATANLGSFGSPRSEKTGQASPQALQQISRLV